MRAILLEDGDNLVVARRSLVATADIVQVDVVLHKPLSQKRMHRAALVLLRLTGQDRCAHRLRPPYYLYVLLDLFSHYAVGWMVADRENSALAAQLPRPERGDCLPRPCPDHARTAPARAERRLETPPRAIRRGPTEAQTPAARRLDQQARPPNTGDDSVNPKSSCVKVVDRFRHASIAGRLAAEWLLDVGCRV